MASLARDTGNSGALFDLSGTVPTNTTWAEDIYFTQDGAPMDISGLDWRLTFRRNSEDATAEFALSTDDGTLAVVDDDNGYPRVLRISVAAGALSNHSGDYIADLASQDVSSKVDLWAHGLVSLRPNPVSF